MDGMDAIRQHQQIPAPLPLNHLSREELDVLLLRQRQRTEQAYAGMVRSGTAPQEDEDPATPHRQRQASFSSMDTEINLSMEEEEEDDDDDDDDDEYVLGI
ncbi:hypothetical protein R5R35_001711 [Gryllus longicercus]|uniref:Uncharacterized protein n=1 Tax=Gryllus longicercus TaxID=2509291 RepID=A0AAN9ZFZ3_9ORTH